MSAHNFRHAGRRVKVPVGESTTIREGCLQKIASNLALPVTDGVPGAGVALESLTTAAGGSGEIIIDTEGVFIGKAATGVNFGAGDPIYPTGSEVEYPASGSGRYVTEFDAGAQNNVCAGYTVDLEPPSAGFFYYRLCSTLNEPTTHS
jgi:predicted RecA/RadA family phage recombinase